MALRIGMVTADCADPKALAAFWTAALQTSVVFEVEGFVMLAPPPRGRRRARLPVRARGAGRQEPAAPRPRRAGGRAQPARWRGWSGSAPRSSASAVATSTASSGRR